jgi:HEPN domain-containing protein
MPRSEKQVLEDNIKDWLNKAEEDYEAAKQLSENGSLWNVIGFHCQQAVEKYLKAVLTSGKIEFSKTHNLKESLDLLLKMKPALARELKDVHSLTPYAISTRYPGDSYSLSPEEAKEALLLVSKTRKMVSALLKKRFIPK